MTMFVKCDCGVEIRAETTEEFVDAVQEHGRRVHNMEVSRDQALALATDAP